MGISGSNNNINKKKKSLSKINEKKIKDGENLNMQIIINKSEKSICEIKCDNGYGTGFFCILRYPDKYNKIYCLITNYHVIDNNMINYKENIEIIMNNKEIKINLNNKRKIWINEEIDYTCIEIIKEDNIIENINPFDINDNCYNNNYDNKNYNKKGIIISSIGSTKYIEIPQGIFYYIKNNNENFYHDCNTEGGFSGGPIILINNLSIIGIHKGYDKNENKNIGIYLNEIINNINKNKEYKEKNEIKCIIYIDKNNYKEDIILFNNNDDNKNEFIDNINVYINENKIDIKNDGNKWKINYNFKNKGEYEIKIIFNKILTSINSLFEECSMIYYIDLSNFNTSKVTDMGWMFNECHKLRKIKGIERFDTNQVINMKAMFQECNELEELDLSNFNTSKVTDMGFMFAGCCKLRKIKGIEKFDTNQVINMKAMFQECDELEE